MKCSNAASGSSPAGGRRVLAAISKNPMKWALLAFPALLVSCQFAANGAGTWAEIDTRLTQRCSPLVRAPDHARSRPFLTSRRYRGGATCRECRGPGPCDGDRGL